MSMPIDPNAVYRCSPDVVARTIEGELILIPIASGIGDAEDDIYTLNETGRVIWEHLDGNRTLRQIVTDLSGQYGDSPAQIEADVIGLVGELVKRKMLVTQ